MDFNPGGILESVRQPLGPLPLWGWALIGAGGVVALRAFKGKGAAASTDTGAPIFNGASVPASGYASPVTLDSGQSIYDPSTGQVAQAGGAPLGASAIHDILAQIDGSHITGVTYNSGSSGFSANNNDIGAIEDSIAGNEEMSRIAGENATNLANTQGFWTDHTNWTTQAFNSANNWWNDYFANDTARVNAAANGQAVYVQTNPAPKGAPPVIGPSAGDWSNYGNVPSYAPVVR